MTELFKSLFEKFDDLSQELYDNDKVYGLCQYCFELLKNKFFIPAEKKRLVETIKDVIHYHELLSEINTIYYGQHLSDDSDGSNSGELIYEINKFAQIEKDHGNIHQSKWIIQQYQNDLTYWENVSLVGVGYTSWYSQTIKNIEDCLQKADLYLQKVNTLLRCHPSAEFLYKDSDKQLLIWIRKYYQTELNRINILSKYIPKNHIYWKYAALKTLNTGEQYYMTILNAVAIDTSTVDRYYRKERRAHLKAMAEEIAEEASGLEECPVCYRRREMSNTKCKHQICANCLHQWLAKSDHCPMCREALID